MGKDDSSCPMTKKAVLDIKWISWISRILSTGRHILGDEAIDKVQHYGSAIQLIVLDMLMPGKERTRDIPDAPQKIIGVRVAFISGFADEHHFADVMKEGALAWFKNQFHCHSSQKNKRSYYKFPGNNRIGSLRSAGYRIDGIFRGMRSVFEYYTLHILLSQSYFYTASAPMPKTEAGISDIKK